MRLTQELEELRPVLRSSLTWYQAGSAWAPLTVRIGAAGPAVPEGYGGAGSSTALGAAFAADEDPGVLPRAAAVAKSVCSEAFSAVAGEMIQLHGGIGITRERDAHGYFKRAHGAGELFGPPSRHRARLAAGLGMAAR
ncbi:acyl-CoA dehydrogenase family protein [Streptomyces sp. JV185]|uniref:acyl-CoA dehydrogenase family protein n=1 Tax=Streptomyces sp. JV185 TaxID=858638 RepID=UPI002E78A641|nr:acyl-CoA dehydrogenase family protein [Streptomyces sp. JV185]